MTAYPEFEMIRVESEAGGLRRLILDDPDKRNAIGPTMRDEMATATALLAADEEAKCLIVAGEGKAFCAGADLLAIFEAEDDSPSRMRGRQLSYYQSFLGLRDLEFPTVAAVDGAAIGAGLNLALVCDVNIAGPRARYGATFSKLGLHPGGGCTYFLTRAMGPGRALFALLRGAVLDGREAFDLGLADHYAEDALAAAEEWAAEVVALDPGLVRDMKKSVAIAAESSFEATVGIEAWAQTASAYNPGVKEDIRAAGRSTRSRRP